tara:strand:- start:145 stop:948 length:804 start_codon:yes stop_codon:yes gene_type:complete
MKSADIVIGITTYDDISNSETARAVYNILHQCDAQLTPEFINWHEPVNIPIETLETWSHYWMTDAVIRGQGAPADIKIGAIWCRRRSVRSWGMVDHASGNNGNLDSTLIMRFNQKSGIDWFSLFSQLCALLRPAHGMLHQFPPQEKKMLDYNRFDSAVVGERAFTGRVAKDGNKVFPDLRKRTWPRQFKYLPELAWANYLGPELSATYDAVAILNFAARAWPNERGVLFRITDDFGDVTEDHERFSARRLELRDCFVAGTFRRILPE